MARLLEADIKSGKRKAGTKLPQQVVYISSLSKTISPGLLTAFIHVPDQYHEKLVTALYPMNISISPLLATVSAALIEDGAADEIIAERQKGIMERNVFPWGTDRPKRRSEFPSQRRLR